VLDIRDGGQPPCGHVTGLIAAPAGRGGGLVAELARSWGRLAALAAWPQRWIRQAAAATARSSAAGTRQGTPPLTFQLRGRSSLGPVPLWARYQIRSWVSWS
jgi:hypothetical protein